MPCSWNLEKKRAEQCPLYLPPKTDMCIALGMSAMGHADIGEIAEITRYFVLRDGRSRQQSVKVPESDWEHISNLLVSVQGPSK